MPRALTMRRARVAEEQRPAYVDALQRAARRREDAGQHLWLFRHATRPDIFVEFREGPDAASLAPNVAEDELEQFAEYAGDGAEVWLEVRPDGAPSADTR